MIYAFFLFVHALFINTLRHAMYTFKITMGFEFVSEGEFLYFLCTCFFYEKFVKHSYDSLKIEAITRKKIADACEMNALSEMSSPHCAAYLVLVFFSNP